MSSPTAATSNTQIIIIITNTTHGNSQGSEYPVANLHGCSPRTPRESIAPPPFSFPRHPHTNSHGTKSGPSAPVATPPSTTQQATAQRMLRKSHTRAEARDAKSCHVDPAVGSTSCRSFGRHTEQSVDITEK
ncbi:hypothetical protein TcCL_Unassigned05740 [Trypanosoma cruzi]|nr:hypothetical protein TcCL_Unassigned05740 [Trypanosoma cruzi]